MPQHCQVPPRSLLGVSLPVNPEKKENLIDTLKQLPLTQSLFGKCCLLQLADPHADPCSDIEQFSSCFEHLPDSVACSLLHSQCFVAPCFCYIVSTLWPPCFCWHYGSNSVKLYFSLVRYCLFFKKFYFTQKLETKTTMLLIPSTCYSTDSPTLLRKKIRTQKVLPCRWNWEQQNPDRNTRCNISAY